MRVSDLIRYTLWGGIIATANANRRYYRMTTTWAPHLFTNTLALLLPDLIHLLPPHDRSSQETPEVPVGVSEWRQLYESCVAVLCNNPRYVAYATPLAISYLVSHPRFNIYKGDLAELRLAGFGLDALPHAATAFGLVGLVSDFLHEASARIGKQGFVPRILHWGDQHQPSFALIVLGLVTLGWELGEYKIFCYEMSQRGDPRAINMQWSPNDTMYDCASNAIGWALHLLWRHLR